MNNVEKLTNVLNLGHSYVALKINGIPDQAELKAKNCTSLESVRDVAKKVEDLQASAITRFEGLKHKLITAIERAVAGAMKTENGVAFTHGDEVVQNLVTQSNIDEVIKDVSRDFHHEWKKSVQMSINRLSQHFQR